MSIRYGLRVSANCESKLRFVSLYSIKPTVVSLDFHVRHVFNYRLKRLITRGLWLATALSGRKVFNIALQI